MYERTQAQINLNALEANIAAIRQKIGSDTKLLGVIKADAYGHGAAYIGRRTGISGRFSSGGRTKCATADLLHGGSQGTVGGGGAPG